MKVYETPLKGGMGHKCKSSSISSTTQIIRSMFVRESAAGREGPRADQEIPSEKVWKMGTIFQSRKI
jgi:hypothetical protein